MTLATRLEKVAGRLEERAARHRVPGATLAVLDGDEIWETATGVVNQNTGVEATPDSVFQIGSITKLFTSTLVMQLVEQGRVELDAPILHYIPELHFLDPDATLAITVRQLLTHTSGIDGDFFEETGQGDDCVERYVLACRALPQLHAPGARFSYCNAGFVVLGRLIEKLQGTTWSRALRAQILEPIGTERMGTLPEHAILYRAAVGHFIDPKTDEQTAVPIWRLPASNGPAGATPFASARDLLRFARTVIGRGEAENGERILSAESVDAMLEPQVELPAHQSVRHWGLGFMLFDWGSQPVIGHDGGTVGQASFLRILPERGVAVALLTNGGVAGELYRDIYDDVLEELAGVTVPPLPEPDPDLELELPRYVGRYERLMTGIDVEVRDGVLTATSKGLRGFFRAMPAVTSVLEPITAEAFLARPVDGGASAIASFLELDAQGRPGYLHFGSRAAPRRS